MAVSGTDLFVANLGSATTGSWVSEVDLASGKPARTLLSSPIPAGPPEAISTSGGDLFVSYQGARSGFGGGFGSATGGSLTEVDVTSGTTVRVVSGSRYHLGDGDAMALFGSNLYVANSDGGSVTELNIATGALVRVLSGPGYGFASPDALAVAGRELFVANSSDGSVTQLSAGAPPRAGSGAITAAQRVTSPVTWAAPSRRSRAARLLVESERGEMQKTLG
jgi:hypothetical protein